MKDKEEVLGKSKILIVEDSHTQAIYLQYFLENKNYEVTIAQNGLFALEWLSENHTDLIISDIVMPEMDGFALCDKIKSDSRLFKIPVILISSLSRSSDIIKGLTVGADNFISKPYDEETLVEIIQKELSEAHLSIPSTEIKEYTITAGGKNYRLNAHPEKVFRFLMRAYEVANLKNNALLIAQYEIYEMNKTLEQKVQERTEELAIEIEERKKANQNKDKLFSIISHDLKSPFQGLLNLTAMMANEKEELTLSELTKFSKALNISANNLYQLLENLLEWALVQKDSINFSPQILSLSELIEQNIKIMNEKILIKRLLIKNEVHNSLKIYADERMIDTVIRNLLSNAIKFTKSDGSIVIQSKVLENNMLEISVNDNGIGMTEDTINNLFNIGVQMGTKGTDGEPSTGLGLILCKEFVEINNGTIWIDSVCGRGSTFYFTVPIGVEQ